MDYPQIIYIALSFMGSGMHLAKNGETREEKYHFGKDLLARMVITLTLNMYILGKQTP